MTTPDTEGLWRVYHREWVTVHVLTAKHGRPSVDDLVTAARDLYDSVYAGRVRPDEVRYHTGGAGIYTRVHLQLLLPTLKGEFISADLARAHAEAEGYPDSDAHVVIRDSRADHDLRAYGVRKLATDAP